MPQQQHSRIQTNSQHIAIIGTGLIGASFAAALRANGFKGHISGCARRAETVQRALQLGFIDSGSTIAAEVVKGADLVLLAVPMMAIRKTLAEIAEHLKPHCIVTDAGSAKGQVLEDAQHVLGRLVNVVPGHPLAGKEHSGVDAADETLYSGQLVILTPDKTTSEQAVAEVTALWQVCGARVEILEAGHHDRVLAATSHLPHVVAFSIVDMLSQHQARDEVFRYSAGGFRDFTRIASGDPVMWRDICLSNREPVGEILVDLIEHLRTVQQLIDSGDAQALENIFGNAKTTRDALIVKYQRDASAQQAAREVVGNSNHNTAANNQSRLDDND